MCACSPNLNVWWQNYYAISPSPFLLYLFFFILCPMSRFLLLLLCFCSLEAGYTIHKGKLVNVNKVPVYSAEEHFARGMEAVECQHWDEAVAHLYIVEVNFSTASFYPEALFYLGASHYFAEDYESANEAFNNYLRCPHTEAYLEEVLTYKMAIAQAFRQGAKKRILGYKSLPKWMPAGSLELEIYEEIIASAPCHLIAAQALYAKACTLYQQADYRGGVEALQGLIRRFPKHELAPDSYLLVQQIYLAWAESEPQNPDLLPLAHIHLRKFRQAFPKEERLEEAQGCLVAMEEVYAKGFFEMAQFYERTDKPEAAVLYYRSAIRQFPHSNYAKCSARRLSILGHPPVEPCDSAFSS